MLKGLLTGAGIFLAGLVLGVVLLGQPGSIGAVAGPEVTFPVTFNDTAKIGTDGDFLTEIQCTNQSVTFPSAAQNTTSTVNFPGLTGHSLSANQAYFIGVETSTANVVFNLYSSSTAGGVMLVATNYGGPTWLGGIANATVCYIEF